MANDEKYSRRRFKMNVTDAILKRTSIRKWKSTPVEKEKIVKVLEAGRRAPSWGNVQPWQFIVVTDTQMKKNLVSAANNQFFVRLLPAELRV